MNHSLATKLVIAILIGSVAGYWVGGGSEEVAGPGHKDLSAAPADVSATKVVSSVDDALNESSVQRQLKALRRLSQKLEVHEIPGFLDQLQRQGKDEFRALQWDILGEWALVDPMAALAYAQRVEERFKINAVSVVVGAWGEVDEAAALAWVSGLPKGKFQQEVSDALINSIGKRDLSRFIEIIFDQKGAASLRSHAYHDTWKRWVGRDPRAAIEAAMRLPDAKRGPALGIIASTWGMVDPKAAMAWALELPLGAVRNKALTSVIAHLFQEDPEMALRVSNANLVGDAKVEAVRQSLYQWERTDRAAALAWAEQLPPGEERRRALQNLVDCWSQSDPFAAVQYTLSLPNTPNRSGLLSTAFRRWVATDYDAATRWLTENRASTSPDVLTDLVRDLSFESPSKAASLLSFLPEKGSQVGYTYQNLGERWAWNDPARAYSFWETLPEGSYRDQFLLGYVSGLSQSDPKGAGQQVLAMAEGKQRDQLIGKVASEWATKDPYTALEWVAVLPEGASRDGAIGSIVGEWANSDSASASNYINSLPAGSTRDVAVQKFASTLSHEDPEGAAIWAVSIGDEKKRQDSLNRVIRSWKQADPNAAVSWIKASSLPSEWKQQMLK